MKTHILLIVLVAAGCATTTVRTTRFALPEQPSLMGKLEDSQYVSSCGSFAVTLPLTPHDFRVFDRRDPASGGVNAIVVDDYGMQLSILVTPDPSSGSMDWLDKWLRQVPDEIVGAFGGTQHVRKSMLQTSHGPMALLVKGPNHSPDGFVLVTYNGILVYQGQVFDVTVNNHMIPVGHGPDGAKMDMLADATAASNFRMCMGKLSVNGRRVSLELEDAQ